MFDREDLRKNNIRILSVNEETERVVIELDSKTLTFLMLCLFAAEDLKEEATKQVADNDEIQHVGYDEEQCGRTK